VTSLGVRVLLVGGRAAGEPAGSAVDPTGSDDDESANAAALERAGPHLSVEAVPTAAAARERLTAERPPDCVVCRDELPDGEGLSLYEWLQGVDGRLPFVLLAERPSAVERALDAGVTDCVRVTGDRGQWLQTAERVRQAVAGVEDRRRLAALHDATRDLMAADSREAIAEIAVDAASEVLGFPGTGLRFFDPDREALVTASFGGEEADDIDSRPPFPVEDSPHGEAFRTGETLVHEVDGEDYGLEPFEDTMYVPLGEHGVLSVGRTTPGGFPPAAVTSAEILGRNTTAALDRAEREAELRDREARLERERERLEEFAAVVSHDLRNPLNVADGHLGLARRALEGDGAPDEHLAQVADAHARIDALVDGVLSLAREGERVGDPERTDLRAVARQAWAVTGDDTPGARLVGSGDLGTVACDPERVRTMFENLFANAVEHGATAPRAEAQQGAGGVDRSREPDGAGGGPEPDGGDAGGPGNGGVTVRVGPLDDGSGFFVADDGPGIPPEERDTVFERGVSTADGTGLGLAIVRAVVGAHGWSVRAVESDDGGARFEVLTGAAGSAGERQGNA
jgi:signal transduction histidine kinase/CheY-like chemotaxis protein